MPVLIYVIVRYAVLPLLLWKNVHGVFCVENYVGSEYIQYREKAARCKTREPDVSKTLGLRR